MSVYIIKKRESDLTWGENHRILQSTEEHWGFVLFRFMDFSINHNLTRRDNHVFVVTYSQAFYSSANIITVMRFWRRRHH